MVFRRYRKSVSILTLAFLVLGSFQQLVLPTKAYGSMDASPVAQEVSNVPIGTDDGGHSPSYSETPNNSGIISTPVLQALPETDGNPIIPEDPTIPGKTTKPTSRLKTDGIHRRFVLPEGVRGEYVEARTQNSKVFVKENGNFAAIIKNDSLHYQDQQGKWQDIDSRLKTSNHSGFDYESTANRFRGFFADSDRNKLMRFQYGDKWFELNPQDRKETKPQINGDTITYPDIYDGIDLQYIVGSDSLIENIILNKNTVKNSFAYDFKSNNLTHRLETDGSITFLDKSTGSLAFKLAKPYMYDANGEQSTNVTLKLDESVKNKAVLTVEADASWLNSPERAFPVVIDPDVILQQDVQNTFVRGANNGDYSTTNFNNELDLEVGYFKDINNIYKVTSRAYLNFDVKNKIKLAENSTILSAKLNLYRNSYLDADVPNKVYKVDSPWNANTINWNNQPTTVTDLGLPISIQGNLSTFDVTTPVRDWLLNSESEYGFSVRSSNETTPGRNLYNSSRYGINGPQLEVEWTAAYYAGYTADIPSVMLKGQTITLPVTVSNGGSNAWPATGATPVTLSYQWKDTAGNPVTIQQLNTSLPYDLQKGEAVQLPAQIAAPSTPGKYKLQIDMRQGETWFSSLLVPTLDVNITVVDNLSGLGLEKFGQYVEDIFKNKINTFNGNLIVNRQLVDLNGRFPVDIDIYYNSRSTSNGLFGYGWSSNLDQKLVEDSQNGNVTYFDQDGTQHVFTMTLDNKYSAPQGLYFSLEKPPDSSFKLTDLQTGTYTIFEKHATGTDFKISSQINKTNNKLSFIYSGDTLQSIKIEGDSSARVINVTYANGKIDTITSPSVNDAVTGQPTTITTKFEYSGTNLSKIIEAYGTPEARVTSYQYSVIPSDPTQKPYLNKISYPKGNEANYEYWLDSAQLGRVTRVSGSNLVQNPGFDLVLSNGTISNWTTTIPTGANIELDADSFSGKNALKLNKTVAGSGILQAVSDPISVISNTDYALSLYGKVREISSTGERGFNLKGYDTNSQLVFTKYVNVATADWSRYALAFNSATAVTVKLEAVLDSEVTGNLWLDAFQLQKNVSTLVNSQQEWKKTDTDQTQWKAGVTQTVTTTANPGSLVLDKVSNDIVKTDTTQFDFQQGNALTKVRATVDGKLELQRKSGVLVWSGKWWNKTLADFDIMDISAPAAIDTTYEKIDFTDYKPTTTQDYLNAHLEGNIIPKYNEPYTLYVTADDGVRVWFEGSLVIDKWLPQAATTFSWMTPKLEPDRSYKLTIEHYERTGGERLLLEWASVSQARQIIPSTQVWSPYETNGSREQTYAIATTSQVAGSVISWNQETPAGTTLTIETNLSLNNGTTWQGWNPVSNNSSIPGISAGIDLGLAKLKVRATLTGDSKVTPRLYDLTVKLLSKYHNSGTWTSPVYQVSPTSSFNQGTISWQVNLPQSTAIIIEYRMSPDNLNWGAWTIGTNGGSIPYQGYVQYRSTLTTTDTTVTPELKEVSLGYLADNVTSVDSGVDSNNNTETISYDSANSTVITDPNGVVSKYEHNLFGNLIKWSEDQNGKNLITTFEYNHQFNLTKRVDANGEHKYIYDQIGNLINSADPNGDTVVNAYDKNNNLIRSTEPFPYVDNLILNGDFEATLITDLNLAKGWWGKWWKRTSGNYGSVDNWLNPDLEETYRTLEVNNVDPGGQTDYYNAHIEGYIVPQTNEAYTLTVTADDGVRLWFNGVLAIDKWILQNGATSYLWTTPILEAGKPYKVVLEHFEKTGGEQLKLEWASNSVPKQVIPENQVFAKHSNFTRPSNGANLESPQVGFDTPRFAGNIAYGKGTANSANSTVKAGTPLNLLTDGDLTSKNYVELQATDGQAVYAQIDLGSLKSVSKIGIWHYYGDGRTYHGTKTQVSADGVNWITVFDSAISGEYPETENGNVITLSSVMNIRYIRDYLNGSTANQYNLWVDIQAFDSYGQALLLEEGTTNKTSTEGSGAATDWTQWSHWGTRTYWSSESQSNDPVLGNVFSGVTANTVPYLFDYYPYTVKANNTYTFSVMLKADRNVNNVTLEGYIKQGSNGNELSNSVVTKTGVNLTQNWQTFTFTMTPTSNPIGSAGLGLQFSNLGSTGITIFAARPQFEEKAYATSYTDSSRAEESLAINSSVLNQSEGTIEVKVYVKANIKNTSSNRYIFSYEPIDSPSYLSVLSLRHTMSNRWSVWTTNNSGESSEVSISDTLAQGWHTFAVRWSATELALFIDGQKQASGDNPMLPTINGGSLSLGKWLYNSLRNSNTQIDDLRISSRARTDAELSSAYSSGQPLIVDSSTTYMMTFDGDLSSTQWAADQWMVAHDTGSVAAFSFDTSTNYFGNQSLKLEKLNQTTRSYSQQTVTLVPGKTYTLSSWIKSQSVGSSANQGAYLFLRYQDASGNWVEVDSDSVKGTQEWQRVTKTFTLPTPMLTGNVTIGLALAQSTGMAWFDGVQLEKGSTVHDNNLVNNNSLDLWTDGTIYGWTKTPGVSQETLASNVKAGTTSVKINHDTKAEWQGITSNRIPVKPGDDLTLSAYVKSAGFIPNGNQDLVLRFFASDNSTLIAQDGPTIPGGSYDWARIAKTLKVPQGAYYVEISAQIKSSQIATVWLDGVQLQYGNLSTNYSYDPYNNQTEEVNQQGDAVTYQYDWYGNLISQSSAISLNENLISNSSFETLDLSQNPIHWETTGNLPTGVNAGVERNPGGTYTRTSEALNEDGIRIGSGTARFSSNLAYQATMTKSPNATLASNSYLETVTDGSVNVTHYTELYTTDSQPVYLQVDLGSLKQLTGINVRHYYGDARKYHNTKTQISADNVTWITVFDSALAGEYIETPEGHLITLPAGTNARYIRDYVKGSTFNSGNHWIEIQAYDATGQAVMIEEGTTNRLTNPIFSSGLSNWSIYGSPTKVETSPRYNSFGNFSIHVVANAASQGITQSISLNSGREYAQTARIYIVSGSVRVTHSGADYYYNKTSGEKGWVTLVNKIDVNAARTNNFTVYSYGGAAEFYVDAVQLEQKSYSTSITDANRSDETLTIPVSVFTPSQGTVEAWVKPVRNPQTNIQMILDVAETGNNGLILAIATDGRFYLQAGTGSGILQVYSTTIAQKDTMYHIAGKWDSTGVSLYVNGVKQAFTPGTLNIQLNVTPTIGRESSVAQRWLDGWIGDLRISSTSRTDQEIQASYTGGQPIAQDNDTTYKLTMDGHFQPTTAYYGQNTLKVSVPTTVTTTGDYGMLSQSMTVIPGSTYTLSGLLRGRSIEAGSQAGSGAFLQVQFYNAQDEQIDQTKGQVLSGSFDWQKNFMTFETPKEAAKVKVALLLSGHGSAWFDALQLERGSTASRYNILENPSMEMGTNSVAAWTTASFSGSSYPEWTSSTAKEGSKSLSLYSSTGFDGDWRQIITVKPNTTYTFTGWVKTQDLQQLDAQVFGTYYLVEYDANNNLMPMHRNLGNNLGTNDWKRVLYTFTTSPSTVRLRIGASLGNWGQAKGMAWFDGVRLFEGRITDTYLYDEARNFPIHYLDAQGNPSAVTYDLLGNKITETDSNGNTNNYVYDRFSNLLSVTDALGNTMSFSYDINGNKTNERDALGNTTTYQYDLFDRLVRVTKPDGSFITHNYDALGNRVRTIDALGNIYRYKYDGQNKLVAQINPLGEITTSAYDSVGNLITVTNAKGDTTSYSYDRLNRLIQVSDPLNHTVSYTYNPKGNLITKTDSNGNTLKYVYDDSGKLTQEIDALGKASSFIYDEAGHVIRKINANGQFADLSYDSLGRLSSEKDALGGVKTYKYNGLGNLIQVTDQNGNSTNFNYDVLKRLTGTTDALGNTVSYSYDANSNRLTIRDARGNLTTYTYDSSNRPTSVQDAENNLISYSYDSNNNQTSVKDGRGNTTHYSYDPLNRVLSVTDALEGVTSFSYDAAGNRVTVTDPKGNTTTSTYDEANRLIQVTDALGNFTGYLYDANGNLLQETTPNGGVITSTYNGNNWLMSVKDPLNYTESYTYDNLGNRITVTDRRGNQKNYTYDALNRLIKESNNVTDPTGSVTVETNYTYDAVGNRLTLTDTKGAITSYAYDELNRLTSVTDALAGITTYGYDENGNKTSATDPMGYAYTYNYDKLNRLTSATNPLSGITSITYDANSNRLTVTDPNHHTTTYVYDPLNRLTSETNAEGEITSITYDKNGNQLTVTDGNNHTTTYVYNALNQVTQVTTPQGSTNMYTYDKNGNRLTVTDSHLNQTTYTYNLNNQVLTVKDELDNVTTNTYDGNGNILTVTDPLNKVTRYTYDELNRVISVRDPLNNVTTYEYDKNSNRTVVVDAEGGRTTYTYDELNRLKTVTNQIGDTKGYTYDKNGNVLTFTDGNDAVTTYVYDQLNRQTNINYPDATSVSYTYDSVGNRLSMTDSTGTTTYAYDFVNRLLTETNPDQKVNSYAYDYVGNILQKIIDGVTQTFTYDKDNHLKTIARNGTPLASYVYDLSGNVVQVSFENGVSTNYIYDELNRIKQVRTTKGSGAVISNLTYTYDGAGRKATETDQVSGQTTTYHYNDGGWLDVVTTPTGQTTYSYDQNGNMLTKTDASGTTNYLYNKASQLLQMSSPGKLVTFQYDKNGNQTKRTEGTNITNYAYTPGGKLASITNPDGSTISYTYDGDGRQVSQTAGGVTTKLYYDGVLVAKETDVNGNVKAEYLYGLGGAPIKMIRDGVSYYYVYNAHGDTIALTNSSGTVVASYRYDPWGVTTLTGSAIKNPFLYAGQFGIYHDLNSGLDLMITRYYNSSINRFMSPDEFPGIVAKPISHNAYAYVHNDPINNVDPDGHWPKWISNAWNSVTSFVTKVARTVRNAVESAASWVRNQVEAAASWVSTKVRKASNWVSSKKRKIYKSSKATLQSAKQKLASLAESAAAKAQAAEKKAAEAKRKAEEKLKQMVEDGKAAFEDTLSEGKERAQQAFEAFKSSGAGNYQGTSEADYLVSSGKQLILGNYTNDVTALGTAAQIGTGLLGVDLPGDIRDISYDVKNWEWSWSHAGKTTLDAAGVLPLVGALKYTDEAAALLKEGAGKAVQTGEFSIINWEKYPNNLAKPDGPFRLIEGAEYDSARGAANRANQALHAADPSLKGMHIHEIQPVKFGGNPTEISNKVPLSPTEHAKATTWWRMLQRGLEK